MGGGHRVFTDSRYILTDITLLSQAATFVCTFIPRLYRWREQLFLVCFATHWPAFSIIVLIGKAPETVTYSYMLGCYFFCTFVAQIRFVRIFPFLVITPLLTLILIVTTQVDYFNTHSHTEMAFWPSVFFPVILLRSFEARTRTDFASMEKSDRKVEELESNITVVRSMVASFFPATPTYDLLLDRNNDRALCIEELHASQSRRSNDSRCHFEMETLPKSPRHAWSDAAESSPALIAVGNKSSSLYAKKYTNTAMIVTDLAGFTQWTATHNPSVVISLLTKMFLKIDGIMPMYNVEKITTVGDAFIGVIFDGDAEVSSEDAKIKLGRRALLATQFGCKILCTATLGSAEDEREYFTLEMRVGFHVGDFVGGFVGTKPPKFDCFGDDFEVAKRMESSGTPGFVHLSSATAAAILRTEEQQWKMELNSHTMIPISRLN